MSNKSEKINGKKVSIYLRVEQLEYIDKESAKLGFSRSRFIEYKVLPPHLRILIEKRGRPRKEK